MTADYGAMLAWVREREAVRVRKDHGDPFPWTDDPVLRAYRFCNVRREDDRVTRWVRERVRDRYADHPHLWFMLCVARVLNWPPTLEEMMIRPGAWPAREDFTPAALGAALNERAAAGLKVFTGAYLITAPPQKGDRKTTFVAEETLGNLWRDRDRLAAQFRFDSLQHAHARITSHRGWGPFMAYQVVVDARFCPALLADARDVTSWAAAGPGTLRGLNRVYGRATDAPLTQRAALVEVLEAHRVIQNETDVSLDLSDVPNVLCETDKYLRVLRGEGAPRARYVPGRGS